MTEFYRAFEEAFRGSRKVILKRLDAYRPLAKALIEKSSQPRALDLGCGRGEWLEWLAQYQIKAYGVDLDEQMLKAARAMRLRVKQQDALTYLRSQPDNTWQLVTAFHLVEHLSFEQLEQLLAEAYRVLAPGGVLLLETPNPENISVATNSFHLDPTHNKPLPPDLLSFLATHHHFASGFVLRLDNYGAINAEQPLNLNDVFYRVSPDYAVIAQKPGDAAEKIDFEVLFSENPGHGLTDLALRYQQQSEQKIQGLSDGQQQVLATQERLASQIDRAHQQQMARSDALAKQLAHVHQQQQQALEHSLRLERQHQQEQQRLERQHQQEQQRLERQLQLLTEEKRWTESVLHAEQSRLAALNHEYQSIIHSHSWRVTKPVRLMVQVLRHPLQRLRSTLTTAATKSRLRRLLMTIKVRVLDRAPWLKRLAWKMLDRMPALKARLFDLYLGRNQPAPSAHDRAVSMPQRAQRIHQVLLQEIKKSDKS